MQRRRVWSDPQVRKIAMQFLPIADEVGRLQRGKDPECLHFQKIAEQGHYAGRTRPTSTRQGIYACAPSGELLASINHRDPKRVAKMLETALTRWKELPRERRIYVGGLQEESKSVKRLEDRFPEGGLVLQVFSRDLPREDSSRNEGDWRTHAWNRDNAWFTKEEARRFLPLDPERGDEFTVPRELIERLVRFNMTDNVRGQTSSYKSADVEVANLVGNVESVTKSRIKVTLAGQCKVSQTGQWSVGKGSARDAQERGFDGSLLGVAEYDVDRSEFVAFELIALGKRWGGTRYNARSDDLAGAPTGFAIMLGDDDAVGRVAPAGIWHYPW